jgi:hypothetical protein
MKRNLGYRKDIEGETDKMGGETVMLMQLCGNFVVIND